MRSENGRARPVVVGLPDSAYAMQREFGGVRPRLAHEAPKGKSAAERGREKPRERRTEEPAREVSADPRASGGRRTEGARLGVISDSHGYLDPAVLSIFTGVAHIVHAGDIGAKAVLAALEEIAPVTAVAGNLEPDDLAASLPREAAAVVGGVRFVVAHKRKRLFKRLAAGKLPAGLDEVPGLVIYGHDHVPASSWVDGTLFLNPGTASSPDDEDDDPTVAVVEDTGSGLTVTFFPLRRRDA